MATDTAIVAWAKIARRVYTHVKPSNAAIYGVRLYQLNPQFPTPTYADIPNMHIPTKEEITKTGARACSIPMRAVSEGELDMTTGKPIIESINEER